MVKYLFIICGKNRTLLIDADQTWKKRVNMVDRDSMHDKAWNIDR